MSDRPTLDLRIVGRLHEVKTFERGPDVLVLQVTHGKDKNGNFRPSSFVELKVFPSKSDAVSRVRPDKGDMLECVAWGSTDEWTNKEGNKQRKLSWALSDIKLLERKAQRDNRRELQRDRAREPVIDDIDDIPF